MLERLILECQTFREGLLGEYHDDPDGVLETISEYTTSCKRAKSILNKAERRFRYDMEVASDEEFMDEVYER